MTEDDAQAALHHQQQLEQQQQIQELWNTYNAIMAGAWPGDEYAILKELEQLGEVG